MTSKTKPKTKTCIIPVETMRRWKLTPEDLTILKLSLMSWKSSHKELERRRKSLLNRMCGDFFMILYAHGHDHENANADANGEDASEDLVKKEAANEPDEGSLDPLSSGK